MTDAFGWPDVVAAIVVLFGGLRGLKRGLVGELAGTLALGFAIYAAFRYPGMWDAWLAAHAHVARGATHVVGMIGYALLAYAVVRAIGGVLGSIARLPILGVFNGILGAAAGAAKAVVFLWAIVYAAHFFPLPYDVREDLRRSPAVALVRGPDDGLDAMLRSSLPPSIAPFANALFPPPSPAQADRSAV